MGLNGEAALGLEWGTEVKESKESGLNRDSPERQVKGSKEVAESSPEWHQPPFLLASEAPARGFIQAHLLLQEEDETAALLCAAARKGCYDMAQQLLSQGRGAINSQDATGRTPLFWATEYRHKRLVELLLSHGADPDVRDKVCTRQGSGGRKGKEAHPAVASYKPRGVHIERAGKGQDPAKCPKESHSHTWLGSNCTSRLSPMDLVAVGHWAPTALQRMLLEAGSDLNATNHLGNSPLHLAAQEKCHECLSLFLACGAVSLKNKAGQLPQQCTQVSSPSCRALQAFSGQLPSQVEQILSRDISRGFEQVAIPCLNMVDQESYPRDFLYITGNIMSGSMLLPTKAWDQSQGCRCDGGCTMASCPCILRSQCSWTFKGGQLRLDTTGTAPEMGSIYECSMLCACSRSCPNRVVQRGLRYFGELISNTEAAHREEDTYYFVVDMQDGQQCCLDGRYYGNVGRFLNHSCQPNLVALQVALGYEIPGIAFFSTRAIPAGEELG
ncbi:hypothetical protein Chor_015342 [Crotalus horridus]